MTEQQTPDREKKIAEIREALKNCTFPANERLILVVSEEDGTTDEIVTERGVVIAKRLDLYDAYLFANAPEWLRFLLSELDKRDECTKENPCRECLKMSVDGYKEIVRELEGENRKLREERDEARSKAEEAWKEIDSLERLRGERDKLIEGLRWYADEDTHEINRRPDGDYAPIVLDHGQRARDILKEIGVTVE